MSHTKLRKLEIAVVLSIAVLAMLSTAAVAQSVKVKGVIISRAGTTMTMQTADTPKLVVLLRDKVFGLISRGWSKAGKCG